MDNFLELQTAVYNDLTTTSDSSLFSLTTVKLAINRSYIKAGGLFPWTPLEDAKITNTQASQEYYDYPQKWRADSAWKLIVDGEDYGDPLTFKDYLYETENDIPSGADRLWSSQWRRFFIYPTPTTTGSSNISIWGYTTVDTLVNDEDTTIFSYAMQECNEAIALEAGAILRSKAEDNNSSMFKSVEAKNILAMTWSRMKKEKSKYERTQPLLEINDMFGNGNSTNLTGRFDI